MDSCRAWHEAPLASDGENDAICSLSRLHKGARGVVSLHAPFAVIAIAYLVGIGLALAGHHHHTTNATSSRSQS